MEDKGSNMAITIYTKTGCPFCAQAMESFTQQNVAFTEINLTDDPEKIDELEKLAGVKKVPTIVDNGQVTVGFNGNG